MKSPRIVRDPRKMWELFTITLQLGAFTFGGGYAMFPLMRREYVEKRNWFSDSDMLDMLAVSQSLPGMISVNASIMVGLPAAGPAGRAGGGAGAGAAIPHRAVGHILLLC